MMEEILKTVAPYIATVVGLLMSWAVYGLNQYIRMKTKNEAATSAVEALSEIVNTTVMSVAQTAEGSLADGKFTKAEGEALKMKAINTIRAQVPPELNKQLSKAVNHLHDFVDDKIEAAVMGVKIARAVKKPEVVVASKVAKPKRTQK